MATESRVTIFSAIKQQWQLSLLFIIFLPLLLRLGFWQLERGEEKQLIMDAYHQNQELPATAFSNKNDSHKFYQTITVEGLFEADQYWLLDNKSKNGQAGYEVVSPLFTQRGWLLVNRGWVKAPLSRDYLPQFATPATRVVVTGYFYPQSSNIMMAGSQSDWPQPWPQRVLQMDIKEAETLFENKLYTNVLRINQNSPGALEAGWPIINTLPAKHYGYAVQWFAMSLALMLLYGWALIKKDKRIRDHQ